MEKIDEFLYGILKQNFTETSNPNDLNFNFLCRSEDFIISFLTCRDRFELEFPALNSYHRRIIHRLGRKYNLVHRVEPTSPFNLNSTLRKIYLTKPVLEVTEVKGKEEEVDTQVNSLSCLPLLKCFDWLEESIQNDQICILNPPKDSNPPVVEHSTTTTTISTISISIKKTLKKKEKGNNNNSSTSSEPTRQPPAPKFKILKRDTTNQITSSSLSLSLSLSTSPTITSSSSSQNHLSLEGLSLEEREAKYQKARERIFEGFQAEDSDEAEAVIMPIIVPSSISIKKNGEISVESFNKELSSSCTLNEIRKDPSSSVSCTLNETLKDTSTSCTLNPEAVPFTLNFLDFDSNSNQSDLYPNAVNNNNNKLSQYFEPIEIKINHIYTLKPKLSEVSVSSVSLTHSDLQRILKIYSPAIIKTAQVPTNFAFLLSNCAVEDTEKDKDESWIIEKWIPEFYLD